MGVPGADGVTMADSLLYPGVQVVVRSKEAKAAHPDRLNLDHRGLQACCLLDDEPSLRLLNYQRNSIRHITHLVGVKFLVFRTSPAQALLTTLTEAFAASPTSDLLSHCPRRVSVVRCALADR